MVPCALICGSETLRSATHRDALSPILSGTSQEQRLPFLRHRQALQAIVIVRCIKSKEIRSDYAITERVRRTGHDLWRPGVVLRQLTSACLKSRFAVAKCFLFGALFE
jgi:hypothetical protein